MYNGGTYTLECYCTWAIGGMDTYCYNIDRRYSENPTNITVKDRDIERQRVLNLLETR